MNITTRQTWIVFIVTCLLIVTTAAVGIRGCNKNVKAKTSSTQPTNSLPATVEALVLTYEGITPCSSFVGWSYKVRTDGHPLRIKYKGCEWVERPSEGNFEAPKTFEPGDALFASPDLLHPNVRVQVYKKIQIQIRP
ncbi:MAG: hypothetical protein US33_C0012G0013 [Parcubacteria group bacterium GW2011_GWC1_36_9]|nr:MAG: hypothetical protein US33_C0012G0013 [Parcubacteria group bacterium GW2011_GWC1_36_9]